MTAARQQGILLTWAADSVHFVQLGYETFNDMLLNAICPVSET